MRTIKFRALSMCKGERWVYGDLRHYNRNPHTEKWTVHVPETGLETDIDEVTIGQFTGLLDKNGKEIYEGDIFTISGKYAKLVKYIDAWGAFCVANIDTLANPAFAKWPDECNYQQPSPKWWSDFKDEIEVIGNIHDNPEFLK